VLYFEKGRFNPSRPAEWRAFLHFKERQQKEVSMTDKEPFLQDMMNDDLNDPNLTHEERKKIDEIQLNAMNRARETADHLEDRSEYAKALQKELQIAEGEIQRIRGMAANRESRRVENF
jgi:hypothetical protein